jgi:EAL domain-containing protein (putative c-di-GMP-specific phosphodiesterase class I)
MLEMVNEILKETKLNPQFLELELTESIAMQNVEVTIKILNEISKAGIKLSIDDFGTGYSSLAYLKRYPINKLKIDKSFVNDITTDSDDAAIVNTIVAMAHNLRLNVIAEGVETAEQTEFLKKIGCEEVQGFLFAKPMPYSRLEELLEDENYLNILASMAGK